LEKGEIESVGYRNDPNHLNDPNFYVNTVDPVFFRLDSPILQLILQFLFRDYIFDICCGPGKIAFYLEIN